MRTLPSEEPSNIHCWAARAFLEMEGAGVLPTPHNFDLWFTHVSGADPELSRQIAAILNKQSVMTPEALEGLHASFRGPKVEMDEVVDRAEGMELAAQAMIDEVVSNGDQLQLYGNTLSHWTTQLTQRQTLDSLLQAVTALSTETARASERNRVLEQRLSAASVRITRLKDSMAALKRAATTDPLTGLFDRKAFNAKLRRALAEAKADGTSVSLLMIDVDHFKRVNDTLGHGTGDLVLRLIGRLLIDSVKGRDIPARYGGEEFVVLLVGADLKAGVTVANRIRNELESKQLVKKSPNNEFVKITVSVGVAQFWPDETATSLLNRADAAMYRAKQLGRNQVFADQQDPVRQWQ